MQMYLLMNLPERVLVRSDTVSCLALFSAKVQVQTCQGPDSQSQGYWGLPGSCWLHAQRRANRGSWKPHPSIQWQKLQAVAGEGLGHGPLGSPLPGQPRVWGSLGSVPALSPDTASPSSLLAQRWRMKDYSCTCYQVFGAFNCSALISSFWLCQSFSSENLHSGCLLCPEFRENGDKMNPVFLRTSLGEKMMSRLFSVLLTCRWTALFPTLWRRELNFVLHEFASGMCFLLFPLKIFPSLAN